MRISREYLDTICENHCGDSDSAWWISSAIEKSLDVFIEYLNANPEFKGRIDLCPTNSHLNCKCEIDDNERVSIPCGEHSEDRYR